MSVGVDNVVPHAVHLAEDILWNLSTATFVATNDMNTLHLIHVSFVRIERSKEEDRSFGNWDRKPALDVRDGLADRRSSDGRAARDDC